MAGDFSGLLTPRLNDAYGFKDIYKTYNFTKTCGLGRLLGPVYQALWQRHPWASIH